MFLANWTAGVARRLSKKFHVTAGAKEASFMDFLQEKYGIERAWVHADHEATVIRVGGVHTRQTVFRITLPEDFRVPGSFDNPVAFTHHVQQAAGSFVHALYGGDSYPLVSVDSLIPHEPSSHFREAMAARTAAEAGGVVTAPPAARPAQPVQHKNPAGGGREAVLSLA